MKSQNTTAGFSAASVGLSISSQVFSTGRRRASPAARVLQEIENEADDVQRVFIFSICGSTTAYVLALPNCSTGQSLIRDKDARVDTVQAARSNRADARSACRETVRRNAAVRKRKLLQLRIGVVANHTALLANAVERVVMK